MYKRGRNLLKNKAKSMRKVLFLPKVPLVKINLKHFQKIAPPLNWLGTI
jgi:hypothetical protein